VEYHIERTNLDVDAALNFLCKKRDFSIDRVSKALKRLEKAAPPKTTLDSFLT